MKKLPYLLFFIFSILLSCSNDETTQEQDSKKLESMYNDIITYSKINTETCTDPAEWGFVKMNGNSCGANRGYILYSKKADLAILQKKIEQYNKAQADFSKKWGLVNDTMNYDACAPTTPPTEIQCAEGKPQLQFESTSD